MCGATQIGPFIFGSGLVTRTTREMVNKWTGLGFKGTDLVDGSKVKGHFLGMQVLYKALTYRFDQDPLDHFAKYRSTQRHTVRSSGAGSGTPNPRSLTDV